jgi:Tetracyclin repressor-like, C-terminal domain
VADIDTATFICVTAVEALTQEFVIRQPAAPSRERDRFVDEVTKLIVGYLLPHPGFTSSATRGNPSRAKQARIPAAKPLRSAAGILSASPSGRLVHNFPANLYLILGRWALSRRAERQGHSSTSGLQSARPSRLRQMGGRVVS